MPDQGLRTIADHKLVFVADFRAGRDAALEAARQWRDRP